ncbi:head-tail adaptor [Cohaesibacter sp. ES.047]|uniref:head-tail adaptor protein n=1 Tax=Cohaesibacter sp. ES.047 TaxID=1798205 RepID=UPI000BC095EE|nr:head-tail adaptor protein [Cohaesibacter sp. ES.047]SNY92799.1 head-tail adaptor [Cohaesibacter sp. ES.047]
MASIPIERLIFDPAGLKHRIAFSKPVFPSDAPWDRESGYQDIAEVWAGLIEVAASERAEADQRSTSREISFVVRYGDDLGDATRLMFEGQMFDLLTLHDPDGCKHWLVVKARSALGHE